MHEKERYLQPAYAYNIPYSEVYTESVIVYGSAALIEEVSTEKVATTGLPLPSN